MLLRLENQNLVIDTVSNLYTILVFGLAGHCTCFHHKKYRDGKLNVF